jgi:hypothetical protein
LRLPRTPPRRLVSTSSSDRASLDVRGGGRDGGQRSAAAAGSGVVRRVAADRSAGARAGRLERAESKPGRRIVGSHSSGTTPLPASKLAPRGYRLPHLEKTLPAGCGARRSPRGDR